MAEQGLPLTTTVTQVVTALEQYVDIGKNSGSPDDFIRIYIKPRQGTSSQNHFSDQDGDGLIDGLDGAPTGYDDTPLYVKIRFVKRGRNEIKIEHFYESTDFTYNTLVIVVKFDGGTSGTNYSQLMRRIEDYSAAEFVNGGQNFYFHCTIFGNNQSLLPYNNSVGNGNPMFENDFQIKTYEITEELTTTTVDDSYYTAEANTQSYTEPVISYSIEDPDGVSSTFADLQKDICIKEPVVDEFGLNQNPDLKRICPTCIPNPDFIPPDWRYETIWLNEKTCNWTVRVRSEELFSEVANNPQLREKYVRKGIVDILGYLNKQIIDQDICWNPPENASESCAQRLPQSIINQYLEIYQVPTGNGDGSTFTVYRMNPSIYDNYQIRNPIALELFGMAGRINPSSTSSEGVPSDNAKAHIEIVVPANLINLIPQDYLAEESEDQQQELESVEEVTFRGPTIKRTFKKTLPKLFKTYSEYQSFYKKTEGGHLRIGTDFDQETPDTKLYYFIKYEKQFKQFYSDLKNLLGENNYKLYSDEYGSSASYKSNSKYSGGLTQKLAGSGVKYREAVEVKIIFDKSDESNPFKIRSVKAKYAGCPFYRCGVGLNAFKEKYNNRPTLMAYVSKANEMMRDIDNSRQLPAWKDFGVKYTSPELTFVSGDPDGNPDADSCLDQNESTFNDLVLGAELSFSKAVEYAFNSLNCRDFENYDKDEYKKIMGGLKNGSLSPAINIYAQEELEAYNKALQIQKDYWKLATEATSPIAKFYKSLTNEQTRDKGFFERLTGKTIEEAVANLKNKSSREEFVGELIEKINPCNWESLTLDIINCLLKGLNPAEALQTAVKSLLNSQDPQSWEKIFIGLTPEQQQKIKEEIQNNFGNLPTPWEFKQQQEKKGVVKINDYEAQRQPPQNPGDLTQQENAQLLDSLQDTDDQILQLEEQIRENNNKINSYRPIIGDMFIINSKPIIGEYTSEDKENEKSEFMFLKSISDKDIFLLFYTEEEIPNTVIKFDEFYNYLINEVSILESEILNYNNSISQLKIQKSNTTNDVIQGLEDDRFRNDVNAYEQAVQRVAKVLLESYTQALINSFSIEELRELIDSIPGSEIFATVVATASCPNTSSIDEFLDEVVGGIELNPCMGKNAWYFPDIPTLPGFAWLDVLKFMLNKFIEKIVKSIFAILTKYLLKTLQKILARACDLLSGVGRTLLGNDDTGLLDAIADAFCEGDRFTPFGETQEDLGAISDATTTLQDFLYRYSTQKIDKEPVVDWATAVSQNINSSQFLNIFLEGAPQGSPLFDLIWEATQETEMSNILRTEEDLEELINLIGSYLDEDQKATIMGLLENQYETFNTSEDGDTTYAEFCKRYLCLETDTGFTPGTDPGVAIGFDLEDLFDSFLNGPDSEFEEEFSKISLDPGGDPFCDDLNDPDDPMEIEGSSLMSQLPPELKDFQKELADSVFADLESAYISDTIEGRNSFFNNVLADQDNVPLVRGTISSHEARVERKILFPNAANTVEDHQDKYDDAKNFLRRIMHLFDFKNEDGGVRTSKADGDYPTPTNLFPSTVGAWLRKQSSNFVFNADYKTRIYLEEETSRIVSKKEWKRLGFTSNNIESFKRFKQKPDLRLSYRDRNGGDHFTWGFDLNYNSVYLEERNEDEAFYNTSIAPSYELEINEFTATAPPSGFKSALLKLLPSVLQTTYEIDEETLLQLQVPFNLSGFEELYEKYKEDILVVKIDKDSSVGRKSPQEAAFINFLLDNPERKVIINVGQQFKEEAGLSDNLATSEVTLAFGKFNSLPNRLYGKMKDMFAKKLIHGIYSASREGDSNSFLFGYTKDSEINYQDLLYVDPTADPKNSATWKYSYREQDKVLGKSATENKRVVFLDPEVYGGTYKKPKIYIHPHPYKGWLGIMQAFNPEMDGCSPKRSGWLFLGEISERVNKLENSLKKDKRLEYDPDCVKKAPYDLIADSSTHAYLDGIVTSTIRTYIVENILRTMPTLGQLRFNSQNFDTGMGLFLINRMKEEMKDFPNNRLSGNISKLRYWYLFLEQMVQTVERRIITGEIIKDEKLEELFAKILEVKTSYYYPSKRDRKIFKRITKIAWNSDGVVDYMLYDYGQGAVKTLREGDPLYSKLSNFIDAISFNAFGPSFRQVLKNITDFNFKVKKIKLKELRMYTKIYDIYRSEEIATQISSYLVLNEFNSYQYKIQKYLPEEPYIQDLNKFVLNPKSGLTIGPPINVGTVDGEYTDSIEKELYGDVVSVVDDPMTQHPLENLSPFMDGIQKQTLKVFGGFYLEKYVIVIPKKEVKSKDFQDQFSDVSNRPISVEKFAEVFGAFKQSTKYSEETGELFISDLFGNAVREEEGYSGSIGIRFGVRLSYLPPEGFDPRSEDFDNDYFRNIRGFRGVHYYKNIPSEFDSESFKYPIPLVNFEEDITDYKIKNVSQFEIDNLLKCYIDKLAEKPEYKFLMNYIFNVKGFATMSSIYSYYGFPDSIGEDPGERPDPSRESNKTWISLIMKKTKMKNYGLFKKYYDVQNFNKEEQTDPKHSDAFRGRSKPTLDKNLSDNIRWWQRKRFYERPFDEEGRECADGALAAFDQNPGKPPRTDQNTYSTSTVVEEENPLKKIDPTPQEAEKALQEKFIDQSQNIAFTIPSYDEEEEQQEEQATVASQTETTIATNSVAFASEVYQEAQEEEPLFGEEDKVEGSTINQFSNITKNL